MWLKKCGIWMMTFALLLSLVTITASASGINYDIDWNSITGTTYRSRIVQIALSQVGYFETTGSDGISGSQVKTTSAGNHTAYNKYSGTKTSWCAWFISWCARQLNIGTDVIPNNGWVDTMMTNNAYRTYYARGNYTPQPGDLVVFDWNSNGVSDHVEMVTEVNSSALRTVGGSTSCSGYYYGVGYHTGYTVNDSRIMGYIYINYEALNGTGSTQTGPDGSLVITPTNFPSGALTPGAAFYFRGSITSNYPITSATVSVLSGDGTSVVMSKTVNPNKTSVDFLADGLDSLKFGSLPEGSYIMRLQAGDSSGNTTEWSSAFTEGTPTEDPTPTILITMTSYPDGSLTQGDPFYLRGSITSNYSITSATVSVVDSDGSTVLTKTVTPNKTSVDILADGLDSLKFGSLSSGSYTLKVAATDSSGTTKEETFAFTEGAVTYTVSYNANGGSGAPSTQTLAAGETLTVSSTVPTRSGYTFLGWSTKKGATSQDYTSGDTVTVTQNLILYAVWKDKGGDFTPFKERYTYTTGQFSDIPSSSWCANYVSSVYRFGLMKGITDSFFNASGSITVAQAVVIAARIHNIYHNASDEFPEYDSGNWYDGYLEYARENGIVSGSYNMNAAATRGEFAQILAAALPEDDALEGINSVSLSDIPDVNGTENFASAVLRLYRAGVLNGSDSDGTFYGNSTITRAQVSAVIARMVVPSQRIEK